MMAIFINPGTNRLWHRRTLRLLLILTYIHSACCSGMLSHFKSFPDCKKNHILPENHFYSFTTISVVECVTICGRTSGCYSVNICDRSNGFACDILGHVSMSYCGDLVPADGCRHLQHSEAQALMAVNPCKNGGTYTNSVCYCVPGFAGTWCERYIKSCSEAKHLGVTGTDFYKIQPEVSSVAITVVCNCGAGTLWTMKRIAHPPSHCPPDTFNRTWQEYKEGFGTLECGYFLGLETMKILTDLRDDAGIVRYQFNIYNELLDYNKDSSMYMEATYLEDEGSNYEISFVREWKEGWMTGDEAFDETIQPRRFCTWDNDCWGCGKSEGGGWWFTPTCGGGVMTVADPYKVVWPVEGVDRHVKISYLQMDDHGVY